MTINTSVLDGYITTAAATKSALTTAQTTARSADQAWTSALLFLRLLPARPNRPHPRVTPSVPTPSPLPVTTADLPALANAKIAADTALASAKTANDAAQSALTQALQNLGA